MRVSRRSDPAPGLTRSFHERIAAAYWQHKPRAQRSYLRCDTGDRYHDHCGLGEFNHSLLQSTEPNHQALLLAEMHQMEAAQSERLLSYVPGIDPTQHILDAGAGRGGTSIAAAQRFGCRISGVDLASHQVELANQLARERGCADRVQFHHRNLVDTGFAAELFDVVIANEVTMYVDVDDALAELARVLKPRGRLVLFTWCRSDSVEPTCLQARVIDASHVCRTHRRTEYAQALQRCDLALLREVDLTAEVASYFDLRRHIHGFGSEDSADEAFRSGFQSGGLQYLAVVAERIPSGFQKESHVISDRDDPRSGGRAALSPAAQR